ncbi:MAG: ExeM/NucH family extracellular endonuclease, partial [Dermatophilaceae bacterium]
MSAQAVDTTSPVVISEVYGGGGNSGATLKNDFIELYNNGTSPLDLSAWSVQYASSAGSTWQVTELSGSVPAKGHFLISQAAGASGTLDLPNPDVVGVIAMSGTNGKVALVNSQTALAGCGAVATATASTPACSQATGVVDFVGFGSANDYAGTGPTAPLSNSTSAQRKLDPFTNSGNNNSDFTTGAPTPLASGTVVEPPADAGTVTIAEIQGASDTSPLTGQVATTKGIVTAAYPTGGFNGYVIQTPGTGGDLDLATHAASDALFVFSPSTVGSVKAGDYVQITGTVSEYFGLTELTVDAAADLTKLSDVVTAPKAISNTWPPTDAQRESIESMLFEGSGTYTISNTYSTNQYGEMGLALGDTPLMQWTDVARPGSPEANAVKADNAARGVILDDGSSTNFLSGANTSLTPPYVSLTEPLRVGEQVTFVDPVIVDYRNNAWKLQPTAPVTPAEPGDYPAIWSNGRTEAPANVGGDLKVASFNVLNYFTTLGESRSDCSAYNDRAGNGITTRTCTGPNGPRGAWDAASLQRQQDKIVNAITALDSDVVGLMEIENSLVVDGAGHEDEAVSTLVDALNAKAGKATWAFVPSSTDLPPASEMDVISNAIIYQVDAVTTTGAAHALGNLSGAGQAFDNAREPIAQAFTPKAGGTPFAVVVNHFKSKGSAGPLAGDTDTGDGQGASNASRMAQATALNAWIPDLQKQTGADDVFLAGDFNAYTQEDPLKVLYDSGWTDLNSNYKTGKQSYSFGGMNGSLDHVLANASALARTTGADIWNINAPESIALEYSRYNSHGSLFYDDSPYRSSDHDPVLVGFTSGAAAADHQIQILGINDFHGRIQQNGQEAGASVLAGAVEQLRSENPNTVFAAAGDLIGASTFESFIAHDKPTIDALNAAGLEVSAVGNHEFDQGYDDLINRVMAPYDPITNPFGGAEWTYLGANVKLKASGDPALDPTWVRDFGDVQVGFIGAVTEHLDELVTPAGIAELDITDIPTAVNAEADQLKAAGVDIIV